MRKNYIKGMTEADKSLFNNLVETIKEYSHNDEQLYNTMIEIFKITTDKTKVHLKHKAEEI